MSAVFIFRRDFRISDNVGIAKMLGNREVKSVHFCFIVNPEQVEQKGKSGYQPSDFAIRFMVQSLADLHDSLKFRKFELNFYYGDDLEILRSMKPAPNYIYFNQDHTPFAVARDQRLEKHFKDTETKVISAEDYTLLPIGSVHTGPALSATNKVGADKGYVKYTPFKLKFYESISKPAAKSGLMPGSDVRLTNDRFHPKVPKKYEYTINKAHTLYSLNEKKSPEVPAGGRSEVLKRLGMMLKTQQNYDKTRDDLELGTTGLSAYIKFGCVSIREVWQAIGKLKPAAKSALHDQLIWREFYYNLCYFNPDMLVGQVSRKPNANVRPVHIKWSSDQKSAFRTWSAGKTGIDIVDAGMSQLNQTGCMHNRARLLTANYAVKVLKIDWRLCERYFASKLTDYDPIVNNGNWQWIASAIDYIDRTFNFDRQAKLHDKHHKYRDRWLKG